MNNACASEPQYVGFFMRLLASVIDTLGLFAIIVPLGWSQFRTAFDPARPISLQQGGLLGFLINWVLLPAVVILFWRFRGGTPGKMVLAMEIVDATTFAPPSNVQLAGRYLGYFLSAFVLCIGFVWILWDKRKQGWHDKLAGTVVIKRRA
jgi:uncharacterized RDD family membrane protein YckC